MPALVHRISVVGLGKLGTPLAACLASRGFVVVGAELNERAVACVNDRRSPVREPGVDALIAQCEGRLSATTSVEDAVRATEVTFVVVPTPSEADGRFSNRFVLDACDSIGGALKGTARHLVVITSTVMPGSTGGAIRARLEGVSGGQCGRDFDLCYNPAFIALGTVVRDLLRPELVLVGEAEARAGDVLSSIHERLCDREPSVRRMSWVNAELAKLALNGFVTTKISYANMLTEMCEQLEGGDIDTVTGALGLDRRIGPAALRGGLAFGGPCFPRDNRALGALARDLGLQSALPEATDGVNRRQTSRLLDLVMALRPSGAGAVAILGLAYKPDTDVVIESQGLALAEALLDRGIDVRLYDPMALDGARDALQGRGEYASSMEACVGPAELVVVATPWPEFRRLDPASIGAATPGVAGVTPVVVDCWRTLDPAAFDGVATYIALGRPAPRSRTL